MKHAGNGDTNCSWCSWNGPQKIREVIGTVGNRRTSQDHPNYNIVKIGQKTKKSPGDLRKFAVTQTPVKYYQLTLVWKTRQEGN